MSEEKNKTIKFFMIKYFLGSLAYAANLGVCLTSIFLALAVYSKYNFIDEMSGVVAFRAMFIFVGGLFVAWYAIKNMDYLFNIFGIGFNFDYEVSKKEEIISMIIVCCLVILAIVSSYYARHIFVNIDLSQLIMVKK